MVVGRREKNSPHLSTYFQQRTHLNRRRIALQYVQESSMFSRNAAPQGMSISLSRLVVLITALFLVLTITLIYLTSTYIKQKAISDLAREDARQTSELVFQSLYTAMRKGWTKDEIMEIVERLNNVEPEMSIQVFRGAPVIRQYGDIEGEQTLRESNPKVMQALASGEESISIQGDDRIRFVYPVKVRQMSSSRWRWIAATATSTRFRC